MTYRFLCTTDPAAIDSPESTLGINVTVPDVAARCGMGNLDGKHGLGRWPRCAADVPAALWSGKAAVDIATEIPLPPDAATLVATSSDVDSVGAMAVLVLRKLSEQGLPMYCAIDDARPGLDVRIRIVAGVVTHPRPTEWSPSPLPTIECPTLGAEDSRLWPVIGVCSAQERSVMRLRLQERGAVIARKRPRGRPRKDAAAVAPVDKTEAAA